MNPGLRLLCRIGLATTCVVTAFSLCAPVLAVSLQQRGFSATAIGAFAMISFTTIAIFIPLMPGLFARFGILRSYKFGLLINTLGLTSYALTESFALWCLTAAAGGLGGAAVWNASESLLAQYAPPDQRGKYTGIYQTFLGGALAVGPLAPAVLGLSPQQALWLAAGMGVLSGLIVFSIGAIDKAYSVAVTDPIRSLPALNTWGALRRVPELCVIAFAGGVFEAGLTSIIAAHGSQTGLSLAAAASIVAAIGVGSFIVQYPAGVLADRISARSVFSMAAVLLIGSALLLLLSGQVPLTLWLAALIWGGVGGALYTLSMIQVAHRFQGGDVAAGTASMITGYTLGGALGPAVSGLMLDLAGVSGLGLWLAGLSMATLLAARRL